MKSIDLNLTDHKLMLKSIARSAILLVFIISSTQAFSQKGKNKGFIDAREQADGWYLPVFGQVFENGKKCEDATVKVYMDNEELGTFPITKKGGFRLELDLDNYYTIVVSKDGYITKRIAIDTHLDETIVNYPAYDCFVNLRQSNEASGANMDYFDFPAAIVSYDSEMGGFYHSQHYLEHINSKTDLAIQQASR